MIAYEELVVALTNWRIQQGLGTTGLQFNNQNSGRVNLDLPVADPDSLVEEIVDADYAEEIVSMDEVEEVEVLEAMEDPNSLPLESDTALYDDGEHTSIAEAGSFSPPSEEESEKFAAPGEPEALDYNNDDTQYMEAPSSPDEASVEVSDDAQEASGVESEVPEEDDDRAALEAKDSIESEFVVDEAIDADELEVEEHELVEEQEVIDASGLETEEVVEVASEEVEEVHEVDPVGVSEFDENESTQMGMGASLINLAPGTADDAIDSSPPAAKPDDQ